MLLYVAVPSDDSRCIQFLRQEDPEQRIEVEDYTRHVFGVKSLLTCANYALQQVAKKKPKDDENLVKALRQNFDLDESLQSVRTPQEATEVYQKVREILSEGGFILTKYIANDEEVKSQIPEADRSTLFDAF